jgi:hypothetical protein
MEINVEYFDSIAEESKVLLNTSALAAHNKYFYNFFHAC